MSDSQFLLGLSILCAEKQSKVRNNLDKLDISISTIKDFQSNTFEASMLMENEMLFNNERQSKYNSFHLESSILSNKKNVTANKTFVINKTKVQPSSETKNILRERQ